MKAQEQRRGIEQARHIELGAILQDARDDIRGLAGEADDLRNQRRRDRIRAAVKQAVLAIDEIRTALDVEYGAEFKVKSPYGPGDSYVDK